MKKVLNAILICLFCTLFYSCSSSDRKADISNIDLEINIIRFDKEFWALDTADLDNSFAQLCSRHPDMTRVYIENVVRFGNIDDDIVKYTYRLFRADTSVQRVYEDELRAYENVDEINAQLTKALKRAKYFMPHLVTPDFYFHVSGFNQSVIVGSDSLGIQPFISLSADNYLGEDYEIYAMIGIYDYQRKNMCRQNIVPDFLLTWLHSEYDRRPEKAPTLLDDIIYRGKMLYVVSQLIDDYTEAEIMGYNQDDYNWVKENESAMWKTLVSNGDLYETNPITKGRYVNDGPFTLPFTQESPSRGGTWLGWQIVKSYMKHNPKVTIIELMQLNEGQIILNQSRYNP